jgi:hypothetical protein
MPNPTDAQKQLRDMHFRKAGLADSDAQAAAIVLDSFKADYSDMIKNFNDSAEIAFANGSTPDFEHFALMRDALVQATRDKLKQVLSSTGMDLIDTLVQREKSSMRVSASAQ